MLAIEIAVVAVVVIAINGAMAVPTVFAVVECERLSIVSCTQQPAVSLEAFNKPERSYL